MTDLDSIILKDLYGSVNGLYPFTFYSRYKIEPDIMYEFIDKFLIMKVIVFENDKLYITEYGKKYAEKSIFLRSPVKNKFKNIPIKFLDNKIEINKPYLPELNYISDLIKRGFN